MASATALRLSHNDSAVLSALFDPEASLQRHARVDTTTQNPYNSNIMSDLEQKERSALLVINDEKPTIANIRQAISMLDLIIEQYPQYASAWNNRAQATRMLFDLEDMEGHQTELKSVIDDLVQAIKLASPRNPTEPASVAHARVLASAHTHFGFLLLRASRPDFELVVFQSIDQLRGLTHDRLEELASREFSMGGRYGNKTAQQLAVKTNPYAKLCGSIVKEALQKEIKDFYDPPLSS